MKKQKKHRMLRLTEDACKAVHKRVDAILEAAGVELVGNDVEVFHPVKKCHDSF